MDAQTQMLFCLMLFNNSFHAAKRPTSRKTKLDMPSLSRLKSGELTLVISQIQYLYVRTYVCVYVCVCVCVCVYFLSLQKLLLTEPDIICNARDFALRKYFCVKNLCHQVIGNHSRVLRTSNCAKECRLNCYCYW